MKTLTKKLMMMAAILSSHQMAFAEQMNNNPAQEMANILMHLNHHPSQSEKMALENIIINPDTNTHERNLADALKNMEHKIAAKDKAKMSEIMNDNTASKPSRDIAKILLNINHKPSSDDKQRLGQIIAQD